MTDRETALLKTLAAARDPATRNAAAIALADLGSHRGMARVRELLLDPATAGARGSLLYALREARTRLELAELIELLLTDAPEAREEAFSFLEAGLIEPSTPEERRRAIERLRHFAEETEDEDQRSAAHDALDLLRG